MAITSMRDLVVKFEFGKRYCLHFNGGRERVYESLDEILHDMHWYFSQCVATVPGMSMELARGTVLPGGGLTLYGTYTTHDGIEGKSLPNRRDVSLVVKPITMASGDIFGNTVALDELVSRVREAVTIYNLTQKWGSIPWGNL